MSNNNFCYCKPENWWLFVTEALEINILLSDLTQDHSAKPTYVLPILLSLVLQTHASSYYQLDITSQVANRHFQWGLSKQNSSYLPPKSAIRPVSLVTSTFCKGSQRDTTQMTSNHVILLLRIFQQLLIITSVKSDPLIWPWLLLWPYLPLLSDILTPFWICWAPQWSQNLSACITCFLISFKSLQRPPNHRDLS